MRPVSAALVHTLRGAQSMSARATLCAPGQTGVNPVGTVIPILSGDVKFDASAQIRATLEMTTQRTWPATAADLFNPYGTEVFIERAVVHDGGSREWVALGYFRIDELFQAEGPNGEVRITASDRMVKVVEARLLAPQQFDEAMSVQAVFDNLVGEVLPGVPIHFDFPAASTSFSASHIAEEDRYGFLKDMTTSLGKIMYFAYDGSLQVVTAPNPTTSVWQINRGPNGVLVRVARTLTRQSVYNAVVATGEQPGSVNPVRAVALDLDPASPTYWYGPYGHVPRFYSSTFLEDEAQCATAAAAMLARVKGLPRNVDFTTVPHPGLEVLDAVTVTAGDHEPAEVHVVDTLTMPLLAQGAMTGTTRLQIDGTDG